MDVEQEFDDFVVAHWPRMVRAAQMFGASRADAEDICQQAMIGCYTRWKKQGRLAEDPAAYCYRAVCNAAKRHLRQHRAQASIEEVQISDPGHGIDGIAVRTALLALSNDHRFVLVGRYIMDFTNYELAEILDLPVGTVKSRTSRALSALEELLSDPQEVGRM